MRYVVELNEWKSYVQEAESPKEAIEKTVEIATPPYKTCSVYELSHVGDYDIDMTTKILDKAQGAE